MTDAAVPPVVEQERDDEPEENQPGLEYGLEDPFTPAGGTVVQLHFDGGILLDRIRTERWDLRVRVGVDDGN